jgi:catechol 2,3-dioxygenase
MPLPKPVYYPPFNITRASHAVITSRDLEASRDFYEQVIGLVLTERDNDTLYFRGLEEVCHHSLVIKRYDGTPEAEAIGMRVYTEEDLDKAEHFYKSKGLPAHWIEVPHQGRTRHHADDAPPVHAVPGLQRRRGHAL